MKNVILDRVDRRRSMVGYLALVLTRYVQFRENQEETILTDTNEELVAGFLEQYDIEMAKINGD